MTRSKKKQKTSLKKVRSYLQSHYKDLKVILKKGPRKNTRYVRKVRKNVYMYAKKSK